MDANQYLQNFRILATPRIIGNPEDQIFSPQMPLGSQNMKQLSSITLTVCTKAHGDYNWDVFTACHPPPAKAHQKDIIIIFHHHQPQAMNETQEHGMLGMNAWNSPRPSLQLYQIYSRRGCGFTSSHIRQRW